MPLHTTPVSQHPFQKKRVLLLLQIVFSSCHAGHLHPPEEVVDFFSRLPSEYVSSGIAHLGDKQLMASEENQGSSDVRFTTYFTPTSTTSTVIPLKEGQLNSAGAGKGQLNSTPTTNIERKKYRSQNCCWNPRTGITGKINLFPDSYIFLLSATICSMRFGQFFTVRLIF